MTQTKYNMTDYNESQVIGSPVTEFLETNNSSTRLRTRQLEPLEAWSMIHNPSNIFLRNF